MMKVQNKLSKISMFFSLFALAFILGGCSVSPPKQPDDLCAIFFEKDDWYDAAVDMNEEYGVPIHVPMAMMYQESSFKAQAQPPKDYILFGLIPWGRVSSAYGYSQAKTMTWEDYITLRVIAVLIEMTLLMRLILWGGLLPNRIVSTVFLNGMPMRNTSITTKGGADISVKRTIKNAG